jgi:hypothetical protein
MSDADELKGLVDDALALLSGYASYPVTDGDAPFESLLQQCRANAARIEAERPEPCRMIHHFACTGGTLMSRALAAQPNTMVLSEVDPFSQWFRPAGQFAPTDLIFLSRLDRMPPSQDTVSAMFLAALRELYMALTREGRQLVIRDHTHSHFCSAGLEDRPLLGQLVGRAFDVRQLITVRHPLDSYLSLRLMNSATGPVATMAGYAERYLMFLDAYPGVEWVYYEDFVTDPDTVCRKMANILEIEFNPRWQDALPVIHLSGDSGRKSDRIGLRPRREIAPALLTEIYEDSTFYEELCRRMGYDPDPDAPSIPDG